MTLQSITDDLIHALEPLRFEPPVAYAYNPLLYAREPHDIYLKRFGNGPREIVLVGMNPGPFGMAQTGVPFGDIAMVRDWMGIEAPVGAPAHTHPKRPIQGFQCPRSEVSGARLWGWARARFGAPEAFFARFFVVNYCPLCFMEDSGRNLTPDKLPAGERGPLFDACDRALARIAECLRPRYMLGVGAFAENRIRAALPGNSCTMGRVPHPSPASPAANRGWPEAMEKALYQLGIDI